jgi:sirohydrochlorin cobaltochelatase
VSPDPDSAILLFAHGARDPAWADPFRRIAARLREGQPGLRVELAFLELMTPALAEAVAGLAATGVRRITLVPLFLAQGGHLREDLPRLLDGIRRQHPGLRIDVTSAIGDSSVLTDAIAGWALSQHLSIPESSQDTASSPESR